MGELRDIADDVGAIFAYAVIAIICLFIFLFTTPTGWFILSLLAFTGMLYYFIEVRPFQKHMREIMELSKSPKPESKITIVPRE